MAVVSLRNKFMSFQSPISLSGFFTGVATIAPAVVAAVVAEPVILAAVVTGTLMIAGIWVAGRGGRA
jgi:hypothetical protein